MYQCSQAFHTAVANGNPQKALLIFSDCVFTDWDINVERGIEFNDYFNYEEDISIGQALSNEISFSLFNDERLLNNYAFGEFTALLGVQTEVKTYSQTATVTCVVGNNIFTADSRAPYVRRNGVALGTQPNQRIMSMMAYDGKLYCFGVNQDYCIVYNSSTGAAVSANVNAFMKHKAYTQWQGKGMSYTNHILNIWQGGTDEKYEFVPLGVFIAKRPKAPDNIQIDMTCYDRIEKVEEDYTEGTAVNVSYPVSIAGLYAALCASVGLGSNYKMPNPFINGSAVIPEEPKEFQTATKRDVLKWIAEASGTNARADRDGYVVLDWLRSGTGQTYSTNKYVDFDPYWYQTKTVTKLVNRDTMETVDNIVGGGDEAYLIQDNPLLKGVV